MAQIKGARPIRNTRLTSNSSCSKSWYPTGDRTTSKLRRAMLSVGAIVPASRWEYSSTPTHSDDPDTALGISTALLTAMGCFIILSLLAQWPTFAINFGFPRVLSLSVSNSPMIPSGGPSYNLAMKRQRIDLICMRS